MKAVSSKPRIAAKPLIKELGFCPTDLHLVGEGLRLPVGSIISKRYQPRPALRIGLAINLIAAAWLSLLAVQAQPGGTVVGWGNTSDGAGIGSPSSNRTVIIAAGSSHNLAIRSDGTVEAWGSNAAGERIVPAGLSNAIAIAGGGAHSLAATADGRIFAWGANALGQCAIPVGLAGVRAVAAGQTHSVALKTDGTVVAWGYNGQRQCDVPEGLNSVSDIAARGYHTLALQTNGEVVAWGDNAAGESLAPSSLHGVIAIAAGGEHSVALTSNGVVVAWGDNTYGQCTVPTNLGPVTAIGAGWYHTLALKSDRTVVAWGAGGTNETGYPHYRQTVIPEGLHGVIALSGGTFHSLALVVEYPRIETQPEAQAVVTGDNARFFTKAAGSPPLAYQWIYNRTNPVPGATNSSLELTNALPILSGFYSVVVTNPFGSITSAPARLSVVEAPFIVAPPTNQTVGVGDAADFRVGAVGRLPMAYQWWFTGSGAIPHATNSFLHLDQLRLEQSGVYFAVVTNAYGSVTSAPAWLTVRLREATVVQCNESSLRQAMEFGGIVKFACDGTITLANTLTNVLDTILDANGHQIALSGGGNVGVIHVPPKISLTLINVRIVHGASRKGAGIFNNGGTVKLVGCAIEQNTAWGFASSSGGEIGEGGGIYNRQGVLTAISCAFIRNTSHQASWESLTPARQASGGAIFNEDGSVILTRCLLASNQAEGAAGWTGIPIQSPGLDGAGGAIYTRGLLTAFACSFVQNSALGGAGGNGTSAPGYSLAGLPGAPGGNGFGGAIYNAGNLAVSGCTFASNSASGGAGGSGGSGMVGTFSGPATAGGDGNNGGAGNGAAILNQGNGQVENSTFAWNQASGGAGGTGGQGGKIDYSWGNGAAGGQGGTGGTGLGVADEIAGRLILTNCTVAFNAGFGGLAGVGGKGGASGPKGGQPGLDGINGMAGAGGGGIHANGAILANTILASNRPNSNITGTITDAGFNLSSDSSFAFNGLGSRIETDPKIGALADYGGPTLTIPLLVGSPAIDAGPARLPTTTDQRGFPRPIGQAIDIGAWEFGNWPLELFKSGNQTATLLFHGPIGQICRLLRSSSLAEWTPVATQLVGTNGIAIFPVDIEKAEPQRFYRVDLP